LHQPITTPLTWISRRKSRIWVDFVEEENLLLAEYGLEVIHDATWGKAFEIQVTTDMATV
jgi:hypothetical protein